jgi:hypothetical protein
LCSRVLDSWPCWACTWVARLLHQWVSAPRRHPRQSPHVHRAPRDPFADRHRLSRRADRHQDPIQATLDCDTPPRLEHHAACALRPRPHLTTLTRALTHNASLTHAVGRSQASGARMPDVVCVFAFLAHAASAHVPPSTAKRNAPPRTHYSIGWRRTCCRPPPKLRLHTCPFGPLDSTSWPHLDRTQASRRARPE